MAENCGFRSKFGGFNKDDVLEYINALQEEHSRELETLQQQATAEREAYEKALNDANEALRAQYDTLQAERAEQENLQQLINEQYAANRTLREQVAASEEARSSYDALKTQANRLQQQNVSLQQQATAQNTAREQELRQQLAKAQAECKRLQEENRRYHGLVNDVGRFVVEVRAMGERYLQEANDRCQARLTGISKTVQELQDALRAASGELSAAGEALSVQNSRAEQKLNELAKELERSAGGVPASSDTGSATHFF